MNPFTQQFEKISNRVKGFIFIGNLRIIFYYNVPN